MHFLLHLWRNRCVTQLCFFPESICLGEHKQDLFPRRNMTAFLSWLMIFSFRSEKWLCIWSTQHLCSTGLSFPGLAVASESFTLILPTIYCGENLRISSSALLITWCRGSDFPESGWYKWGLEVSRCCWCCLLKVWSCLCWLRWLAVAGCATPECLCNLLAQRLWAFLGMQHSLESWENPLFCLSAVLETFVVNWSTRMAERARGRDHSSAFFRFSYEWGFLSWRWIVNNSFLQPENSIEQLIRVSLKIEECSDALYQGLRNWVTYKWQLLYAALGIEKCSDYGF